MTMHYELKGRHKVCLKAKIGLTGFIGPDEPQWTLAYGWRRRWQHYKYRRGYYYYYYYCSKAKNLNSNARTTGS